MRPTLSVFVAFFLVCGLVAGCASSKKAAGPHPLAGMWDYSIQTQDGAYTGVVTIAEVDGGLTGSITNDALDGSVDISDLVFSDDKLTFSFDGGDYGMVKFNVEVNDDMFDGTIDVAEYGQMPVSGKRKME